MDPHTEVVFPRRAVVAAEDSALSKAVCELLSIAIASPVTDAYGVREMKQSANNAGSNGAAELAEGSSFAEPGGNSDDSPPDQTFFFVLPVGDGDVHGNIYIELAPDSPSRPDPALDPSSSSDERWSMTCERDEATGSARVTIRSAGYRGALRAASALGQALSRAVRATAETGAGVQLPCAELSGTPAYPWRGFMLDCVRHMFPVSVVKRLIDEAALHALSVFHWHLTDDQGWRLPSRAYPVLEQVAAWRDDNTTNFGRYGGVYTASEIGEVVDHAARRGIVVVPEVDIPGHVRAVLAAMPELSCTGASQPVPIRHGIFEDVLCAGNPDAHTFLRTVFGELCELFPGAFIHLGGDECPSTRWKACPKCRARAVELGLSRPELLHGDLVRTAVETIESHGRRPVGWDEVLESEPPQGVLIMCWRAHECADRAIEAGHDVILCPTERACYFDHKPLDDPREPGWLGICTIRDTYGFRPVREPADGPEVSPAAGSATPAGGSDARKAGTKDSSRAAENPVVLGSQGNLWSEQVRFGREAEYMLWPRLAALSEVLWGTAGRNGASRDEERILRHARWLRSIDIKSYDGPVG